MAEMEIISTGYPQYYELGHGALQSACRGQYPTGHSRKYCVDGMMQLI